MSDIYEKQKESAGAFSFFVFIISGLYLHVASAGLKSLLSLKAAAFFLIGMFAVPLVFGLATYLLLRGISKILMKLTSNPFTSGFRTTVQLLGVLIHIVEAIVIYQATKTAYIWFYSSL